MELRPEQEPFACEAFPGLHFFLGGNRDSLILRAFAYSGPYAGNQCNLLELSRANVLIRHSLPSDFHPQLSGRDSGFIALHNAAPDEDQNENNHPTIQCANYPNVRFQLREDNGNPTLLANWGNGFNYLAEIRDGQLYRCVNIAENETERRRIYARSALRCSPTTQLALHSDDTAIGIGPITADYNESSAEERSSYIRSELHRISSAVTGLQKYAPQKSKLQLRLKQLRLSLDTCLREAIEAAPAPTPVLLSPVAAAVEATLAQIRAGRAAGALLPTDEMPVLAFPPNIDIDDPVAADEAQF